MIANLIYLAGLAAVAAGACIAALVADARQDRAWAESRARRARVGGGHV